jgi:hypothetical protein
MPVLGSLADVKYWWWSSNPVAACSSIRSGELVHVTSAGTEYPIRHSYDAVVRGACLAFTSCFYHSRPPFFQLSARTSFAVKYVLTSIITHELRSSRCGRLPEVDNANSGTLRTDSFAGDRQL